jgi:hypothetical protein
MLMTKKLAVFLTVAAFGLTYIAPVAAQTGSSTPAQTTPKKNTTPKKAANAKKKTPKKPAKPAKPAAAKPKTSYLVLSNKVG